MTSIRLAGPNRLVHPIVDDLGGEVVKRALAVPPMYMPGRRRTGSRPSSTSIADAS